MTEFQKMPFDRDDTFYRDETVKHYLLLAASVIGLSTFSAGCRSNEASYRPIPKNVRVKDIAGPA